jgi:hypothetical protein
MGVCSSICGEHDNAVYEDTPPEPEKTLSLKRKATMKEKFIQIAAGGHNAEDSDTTESSDDEFVVAVTDACKLKILSYLIF